MRFEGALPKRREVVPRSFVKDAEGKRLLCGDFGRLPPRPSRSRLRRRRVCVCVCYNGGGARFSTPSRRIHRTSSRASGSRAAAVPRLGLNRRSVTSREDIFAHESSNRKEKTFERVQLCAPWRVRGESGLASYRLPKPNPARPKTWERSVVARRADGERRLLRVRRRGALHACGVTRA